VAGSVVLNPEQFQAFQRLVETMGADIFWDCPVQQEDYDQAVKDLDDDEFESWCEEHGCGPVVSYFEAMEALGRAQEVLNELTPEASQNDTGTNSES
jgi:hypothetical protein